MHDYHRLIANANDALARSNSEWGQKYWTSVIDQLLINMSKQETVH